MVKLLEGRYEQAVDLLNAAMPLAPKNPRLLSDLAAAELEASRVLNEPHRLPLALAAADRAVRADPSLKEARFNRALVLQEFPLAHAAAEDWQVIGQGDEEGWAQEAATHLGALHGPTDPERWEKARPRLEQDCTAGRTHDVRAIVARFPLQARRFGEESLLAQWSEDWTAGRSAAARRSLAMARQVAEALADTSGERMLLNAVAAIDRASLQNEHSRLEALADGQRAYRDGLSLYESYEEEKAAAKLATASASLSSARSPLAWMAEAELAACDYQRHAFDSALARLAKVAEALDPRDCPSLFGRVAWLQGLIHTSRSQYEQAGNAYRRSLAFYRRTGEAEHIASVQHLLFETSYFIGDLRQAWRDLLPALRKVPHLTSPRRQFRITEGGTVASLSAGVPQAAVYFQDEAVRLAEKSRQPATIALALRTRAVAHQRAGDWRAAVHDLERARDFAAALPAGELRTGILGDVLLVDGEVSLPVAADRALRSYSEAIAVLERTEYRLEMIRALVGRARAHRALHDPDSAERDLAAGLVELERQRRDVRESNRATFLDGAEGLFAELASLQVDVYHRPDRAYAYAEQAQARVLIDHVLGPSSQDLLELKEVRRRLPSDVVLVQYLVEDNRTLAWSFWPGGTAFAEIPAGKADLADLVRQLLRSIMQRREDSANRLETQLWKLLLAPLLRQAPKDLALVVVADAPLHGLPFAALRDATGRYLIEECPVILAPSARLWLHYQRQPSNSRHAPASVLAVGDPAFNRSAFPELARLPAAEEDAAFIARLYRKSAVLVREQATPQAFLATAGDFRIVHLGTHATANSEEPGHSYLVLAPASPGEDGLLSANELYGRQLPQTELVVLAGCGTTRGFVSGTEGFIGLAHAFMATGVPQVIGTLWEVGDDQARVFSRRLHMSLASGTPPRQAIREAQLALIGSGRPELTTPAIWAAFQLVGGG